MASTHWLEHLAKDSQVCKNIVNVTVELSSFGRPKEEKLKPHLRPLREAATTTWSKHFLGHSQPSQPGSQRGQPATHHRQRETSNVREPPEDTHSRHGDKRWRQNGSSTASFLAIVMGQAVLPRFMCIQVRCAVLEVSLLEHLLAVLPPVGDGAPVLLAPVPVLGEEPSARVSLSPEGRHLDGRLVPSQGPYHQLQIQYLTCPEAQ
ncbi:hypothetical protein Taro_032898 [Colocasia esculenta]|uniref:Uncharacterized protein n=1 Tax=Colocasia esculenta TaxID=4460 RepID=A0A843VYK5_COLES|nr:hypothetical protein [Colocasia esculenta]